MKSTVVDTERAANFVSKWLNLNQMKSSIDATKCMERADTNRNSTGLTSILQPALMSPKKDERGTRQNPESQEAQIRRKKQPPPLQPPPRATLWTIVIA